MKKTLFLSTLLICLLSSCSKMESCYDKALFTEYTFIDCNAQYLPVVGCDGQTYYNACVAHQHGIRVK